MDNPLSSPSSPAAIAMPVIASSEAAEVDLRLLAASSSGQTDLVLQLLEEEGGQRLHSFKDQVSVMRINQAKRSTVGLHQQTTAT